MCAVGFRMMVSQRDRLIAIAQRFAANCTVKNVQPLGNGNINDTFLVHLDQCLDAGLGDCFVLQRINTQVFRQPTAVMGNMRRLTEHVHQKLRHQKLDGETSPRRWETPRILLTQAGQDHWQNEGSDPTQDPTQDPAQDPYQGFWRGISFIANTQVFDTLHHAGQAQEVGYALGRFHQLISDLPPQDLTDTLVGFHIAPQYLQHYERTLASSSLTSPLQSSMKSSVKSSVELKYCLDFLRDHTAFIAVLEDAKAIGKLPLRLMHGDPKINNVLFDRATEQAISLIDLDTVKPGLVHYDIGDCLRSGCNLAGEETQQWQAVQFDPDLCQSLLQGYNSVAKDFLTPSDYAYLFDAIRLLPLELGLRFLTDYLAGNVYFKVHYPEHNLARALVQFQLAASIESQEATLRRMIQDLQ